MLSFKCRRQFTGFNYRLRALALCPEYITESKTAKYFNYFIKIFIYSKFDQMSPKKYARDFCGTNPATDSQA